MVKRFEWNEDTEILSAVFQALGGASVCWEHPEGAGVFNEQLAREIGFELIEFLEMKLGVKV